MRILCDQNVANKYIRAFEQEDWIVVARVRDSLTPDATDDEIAAYAETNDWIVFTNDDDFYRHDPSFGLLVYSQIEDPRPGDVLDAIRAIDASYESHRGIIETVPDGWL